MSSPLPERYQRYADPAAGQRQQYGVQPREVELHDEADPVVHVPHPYDVGAFVAVRRSQLQPVQATPPRDLTPQPLFDPIAQRMAGGGVLGAGVGWGAAQAINAIAGGMAGLALFLLLLLAARAGGRRGGDTYNITNNNRWWGSSSTRT